jgi:hypothetical protein
MTWMLTPSDHGLGTGTIIGDKAEALAFATTMGKDRTEKIFVGSVKSNPPVPTFEKPSEQLPLDQMGITVIHQAQSVICMN